MIKEDRHPIDSTQLRGLAQQLLSWLERAVSNIPAILDITRVEAAGNPQRR